MNAELKAPSPSNRLKRLGKVNANKNAELKPVAPSTENIKISLKSPNTLDVKVEEATKAIFLKYFLINKRTSKSYRI